MTKDNILFTQSLFFPGARARAYRILKDISTENNQFLGPLFVDQANFCHKLLGRKLQLDLSALLQYLQSHRSTYFSRLTVIMLRADEPVPPPENN